MGLDLYAGTLTRYYSDDWETAWARRAREASIQSMTVRVDEGGAHQAERGDPDEVRRAVLAWREALNEAILDAPGSPRLDWDEGAQRPYFTDKPDWEGYAALMLHAAHAIRPDIGRPEEVPENWREDEAYRASTGENLDGSPCGYVMAPELWLPGDFLFLFGCNELRGQHVVVGSTEALLSNLHGLNERTFRAGPETAARWLSGDVAEAENRFEAHARHGFAIFLYLAEEAVANRLPLKLDYQVGTQGGREMWRTRPS